MLLWLQVMQCLCHLLTFRMLDKLYNPCGTFMHSYAFVMPKQFGNSFLCLKATTIKNICVQHLNAVLCYIHL